MKRTARLVAIAALALLLPRADVQAGGGLAEPVLTGRISGPAIAATIVLDPTHLSPTKGRTTIRLERKKQSSAAVFNHEQASSSGADAWVRGCDGAKGADPAFASPEDLTALTQLRFANKPLSNWMPDSVIAALLGPVEDGGLGISTGGLTPGITDIDNPACTKVDTEGVTRYVLSFTAVIQFAEGSATP